MLHEPEKGRVGQPVKLGPLVLNSTQQFDLSVCSLPAKGITDLSDTSAMLRSVWCMHASTRLNLALRDLTISYIFRRHTTAR